MPSSTFKSLFVDSFFPGGVKTFVLVLGEHMNANSYAEAEQNQCVVI